MLRKCAFMPSFFTRQAVLLVFCFLVAGISLPAQNQLNPHVYDSRISHFLQIGQQDSFFYYAQLKCRLAQGLDSLELWAWERFDAYEAFETTPALALQMLDKAWQQRWRDPRNENEWYPFVYIQASRGWLLFEQGKVLQSMQAYEIAEQLYHKYHYPDFDALELLYKPLGAKYVRIGDNDKAIATFQKGLLIGGENESLAGLYCDIGLAYWNKGDYTASEENYRHGLEFTGISRSKRALLLGALAQTQLDNGQIVAAAASASQSLLLLQGSKSEGTDLEYRCYSRRTAGIASTRLGRFKEAKQYLDGACKDALTKFGPHSRDVGKIEIARAQLYLYQGQGLQSLNAANRALNAVIPDFHPESASLSFPSSANPSPEQFYEENTLFEALSAKADAAQQLFETSGNTQWLEYALECHALAWQAESLLHRVFQYNTSKLTLQNEARTREEAAMNVARLLYEKTGQITWLEKAFVIAERSKAALLRETLQDNLVRQRLSGSDPRFGQLSALRQNLSYFDKKFILEPESELLAQWRIEADSIQGEISQQEKVLRKAYPQLHAWTNDLDNGLPISDDLTDGEALVEYFTSAHWVDVFVFQKGLPGVWKRIPNDTELKALISLYLGYFQHDFTILNDPEGYFQTAYSLWKKLLPAETVPATILSILPDGILNFVPFESLISSVDGSPTLRNAAYLIRKQQVRYAWSLAVLRQQKTIKSQAAHYFLSIAPGFAKSERGLAPLATSSTNWQDIPYWDIRQLSEQNADLQHFLKEAGSYRVIHFSTHAFAGGHTRIELIDQSLLLPDLYALPLQADLVVLSACETGLGKEEKGEGVMSFARAFAQAGAACIVSSLWSVNDQSTARLLGCFYDKIGQGITSAAALREAKLAYLSDPALGSAAQSPYFWAGLVAVGDDRVIPQPWHYGHWAVFLAILIMLCWLSWRIGRRFKT